MAVDPPTADQLSSLAEGYGLGLTAPDVEDFSPFVTGLLTSWDAVEELYSRTAPQPRSDRAWSWPHVGENPLGAWYVRTEIKESETGPLAGRTVAIKRTARRLNSCSTVRGDDMTRSRADNRADDTAVDEPLTVAQAGDYLRTGERFVRAS